MLFFRNEVRRGVVKIIDARIKEAQKLYNASVKQLVQKKMDKISEAITQYHVEKEQALNDIVKAVLKV